MAKRILISGYYGYDNFGDEAILSVLIDYIKRLGSDPIVLSHNPAATKRKYGVKTIKNFNIFGVIVGILSCDTLVSGGGSLLQDVTSFRSLLYYYLVIKLAKMFKKDIVIFAQGIGPLKSEWAKKHVPELLNECSLVTVRDIKSKEYIENFGVKAELVSDPVYSIELPVNGKEEGIVGVQLRAFRSLDDSFLFTLARTVVENFCDRKIELYVFQESFDYKICKHFEKMLKTIYPPIKTEIIHNITQNDMIIKISELEYMIAMRFHAVLVAIKTGVKTLAINYDAKVEKLAYEAFLPLLTLSIDEDFELPFERLQMLNPESLIEYASKQRFEWDYFEPYLK